MIRFERFHTDLSFVRAARLSNPGHPELGSLAAVLDLRDLAGLLESPHPTQTRSTGTHVDDFGRLCDWFAVISSREDQNRQIPFRTRSFSLGHSLGFICTYTAIPPYPCSAHFALP